MNVEPDPHADPSVGELVSQLSAQTSQLGGNEMKLARTEFREVPRRFHVPPTVKTVPRWDTR